MEVAAVDPARRAADPSVYLALSPALSISALNWLFSVLPSTPLPRSGWPHLKSRPLCFSTGEIVSLRAVESQSAHLALKVESWVRPGRVVSAFSPLSGCLSPPRHGSVRVFALEWRGRLEPSGVRARLGCICIPAESPAKPPRSAPPEIEIAPRVQGAE